MGTPPGAQNNMATVGQQLRSAREDRRLSIEQAADATHIRAQYVKALEEDDFTVMPSPVQGRGFLRLYAQFLGLDMEAVLAEARRTQAELQAAAPAAEPAPPAPDPMPPAESRPRAASILPGAQAWLKRLVPTKKAERSEPAVEEPSAPEPVEAGAPEETEPLPMPAEAESTPEPETVIAAEPAREVREEPVPVGRVSTEIFKSIGEILRERRELLSLSLQEIETHTHVRIHYLQALEAGTFTELLSPVQARGMLANYATFLDLNVDAVLLEFADGLQARHRERHPGMAQPRTPSRRLLPPFRTFLVPDLLFFADVAVMILILLIWGVNWVVSLQESRNAPEASGPSISAALLTGQPVGNVASPEAQIQAIVPLAATPTVETAGNPGGGNNGLLSINIIVIERTWLRVIVDGKTAFEGRALPGVAMPFEAETSIEVMTGNAAALQIYFNQRDQGLMGGFGELADRVYTVAGVATATPTQAPTGTATSQYTLTPSRTPSPTATLPANQP
jgi:cytoskeletal protein RodZ